MSAAPLDRGPRALPPSGGLLVLRVWFEPEHVTPLRARIVASADPAAGTDDPAGPDRLVTLSASAASVEDAVRVVRRWLERFGAPAGAPPAGGTVRLPGRADGDAPVTDDRQGTGAAGRQGPGGDGVGRDDVTVRRTAGGGPGR